jgi:hypothetical protein
MTCVSVDRTDETKKTALLWGSVARPGFSRERFIRIDVSNQINWAKQQQTVEKIIVSHRASIFRRNTPTKTRIVETHKTEKIWTDGVAEDEIFYELEIKPSKING